MNKFWVLANRFYKWGGVFTPFARIFELLSFVTGSNAISARSQIGEGTKFYHRGLGCVVHAKTVIGKNCIIFQNVTIGSKWPNGVCEGDAPIIGNDVFIGAGAVLLGNIRIGDKAIIGANAVVTNDIPDGTVAVGIPARIK